MCFYLINKSCLPLKQYICVQVGLSCVFYLVNVVIDCMFRNTFQFSVFFFIFFSYACLCTSVLCHNPMLPLSLDCPFLLVPNVYLQIYIYRYAIELLRTYILMILLYICTNTIKWYRYFRFDRLLKVQSSFTVMLLWFNHLWIYNKYV